ncbi:MAG: DUF4190 domain-containing protein [Microthrixaceae bacterium]|nr:DUF4190 domain-containing protein [Microthrixaceae bacterium]
MVAPSDHQFDPNPGGSSVRYSTTPRRHTTTPRRHTTTPGGTPPPPGGTPPPPGGTTTPGGLTPGAPPPPGGAPPPGQWGQSTPPGHLLPGWECRCLRAPNNPVRPTGLAIAALVVGILSIPIAFACGVGGLFGIAAVVLGFLGMKKANDELAGSGKGMAIGGIVTGVLGLLASIAIVLFWFVLADNAVDELRHDQLGPERRRLQRGSLPSGSRLLRPVNERQRIEHRGVPAYWVGTSTSSHTSMLPE